MAREHVRLQISIWQDDDFLALDALAQHMYMVLISQPRLSYCGVIDYLPSRLAYLASDSTDESVDAAVKRLQRDNFVLVDRKTHELLVRSFIRRDGLMGSPNMVKAMDKGYEVVLSTKLRDAIADELQRTFQEEPKAAGWKTLRTINPALFEKASAKGFPKGSEKGLGMAS